MSSPLLWFGGKGVVAKKNIIPYLPEHRFYREPCVGGCHVIAQKSRAAHEVVNDVDGNLVNFLLQVRWDPELFTRETLRLPYSRLLYDQFRREPWPDDPFQRAVRWFYLNRSGITASNAEEMPTTGWRHSNSSSQNPAQGYVSACNRITEFAARMSGVMIECMSFHQFIPKYDNPGAVWYVDPPYIGRERRYAGNWTMEHHEELAALLNSLKGYVIISYYDHPILEDLYPSWHRKSFSNPKQVTVAGRDSQATELLIMNFQPEKEDKPYEA